MAFYLLSEQVSKHIKVVLSGQGADEAFAGYFWYPRRQAETGSEVERLSKHYVDRPYEEYLQTVNAACHSGNHTQTWLNKKFAKANDDEFMDKVFRTDMTRLIVDYQLVEHALSMPPSLKVSEEGKHPLKQIFRSLLPASVIDHKEGYFPMPALKYVQGEFLEFMTDILTSGQYMTALYGSRLWHLALLEYWLQINVDANR